MKESNHEVSRAIRDLRRELGESQEAFAARMQTSLKTITRYETAYPPKGPALAKLALIARQAGNERLEKLFESHLFAENEKLASTTALDMVMDALYGLYRNKGERWLLEQITVFLRDARAGEPIRHPSGIKGERAALDRDTQLTIWENHLMRAYLRSGMEPEAAIYEFAREYSDDAGVPMSEALVYTRIKFPNLGGHRHPLPETPHDGRMHSAGDTFGGSDE
jgi:transcriptional regulator with XRE-family HTH domain